MAVFLILAAAAEPAAASAGVDWWAVLHVVFDIATVASVGAGLFFVLAGTAGVIRLPGFYTRLHAAGVTDTLGAELILFGLILQANHIDAVDTWQVVAKLLLIAFFLFITSPTATHAVAHAAYRAGEKPMLGKWRAPEDGA